MTTVEIAERLAAGEHGEVARQFGRVLDVGCSVGRLLTAHYAEHCACFGADIDGQSLVQARQIDPRLHLCRARGESLPFAAASFDLVMSRVAIPYMHIPQAVAEFSRVLRPGGILYLTLHTVALPWSMIPKANLIGKIYFVYAILNGLLFHLTQRMVRFPNGRCESFQTVRSMTTALARRGFREIEFRRIERVPFPLFLVVARRGDPSARA